MKALFLFFLMTVFLIFSLQANAGFYNAAANNNTSVDHAASTDDDPFGDDAINSHANNNSLEPTSRADDPGMQPANSTPAGVPPNRSTNPGMQQSN